MLIGDPAHPERTAWLRRMVGAGGVLPEQSEMYVHDLLAEGREEVLSVGGHPVQHLAVDQRGTGGEGSLGTGDSQPLTRERRVLVSGQAMQGMTFGHPEESATNSPHCRCGCRRWGCRRRGSRGEIAQYVGQCADARSAIAQLGELVG